MATEAKVSFEKLGTDVNSALSPVLSKLETWMTDFLVMLPNILVAIVIVFFGWLFSILVGRLFSKVLGRFSSNHQINGLLITLCRGGVLCAAIFIALGVLKLDKTVTSLLAGVGIVGLALGFAFQDLAANLMASVVMSMRRPFSLGDIIETNDVTGVVKDITLRSTDIRTFSGQHVLIPNKSVFHNPIVNFSKERKRRVELEVGVSYAENLKEVEEIAKSAINELSSVEASDIEVFYKEFGGSSINFELRFWVPFSSQRDYLFAKSEAVVAIKQAFDAQDISIPFPIRTLDFGIKGGGLLREELQREENG